MMTTQRTYRESALSARQDARQKLAEFRAARVQKRVKLNVATVGSDAKPSDTGIDPQDFFAETASGPTEATTETEAPAEVIASAKHAPGGVPAVAPDMELETAGKDDVPEQSPEAEAGPAAPGTPVDPNSDLFDLPAAGPGMIWMFHQCGILSLADLASANATEVSSKLGVVGHILNVEPWIAFARERHPVEA